MKAFVDVLSVGALVESFVQGTHGKFSGIFCGSFQESINGSLRKIYINGVFHGRFRGGYESFCGRDVHLRFRASFRVNYFCGRLRGIFRGAFINVSSLESLLEPLGEVIFIEGPMESFDEVTKNL